MDWIPVEYKLPEPLADVLALHVDEITGEPKIIIEWMDYEGEWIYNDMGPVTHWMPLPDPPKGEST